MKCRKCGAELGEAKFCPECGEKRIDLEENLFEETGYSKAESENRENSEAFDENTYTYKTDYKKSNSFKMSEPKLDLKSDGLYNAIVSFRRFLDPLMIWIRNNKPLSTILLVAALLISNFSVYIALGAFGLKNLAGIIIVFYLLGIGLNFLFVKLVSSFALGKYKVHPFSNTRILLFMNIAGLVTSIIGLLNGKNSTLLGIIIAIITTLISSFIFVSLSIDLFDNRFYQTVGVRFMLTELIITILISLLAGVIIAIIAANIFNNIGNSFDSFDSFFNY